MKKITLLTAFLLSSIVFGQKIIITTVLDGPCSGGTPKAIELYVSGTINFADYSVQLQSNANTGNESWNGNNLSDLGTISDSFVYLVGTGDSEANFKSEFSSIPANKIFGGFSRISNNGDDRYRITKDSDGTVIDQYGATDTDGSNTAWEFLDSYAQRKSDTTFNGTFNESNWIFAGKNTLDNKGLCNTSESLSSIISLGSYTSSTLSIKENKISDLVISSANGTITTNKGEVVTIYNVLGQKVSNQNLTTGIYVVLIQEGTIVVSEKVYVNN